MAISFDISMALMILNLQVNLILRSTLSSLLGIEIKIIDFSENSFWQDIKHIQYI